MMSWIALWTDMAIRFVLRLAAGAWRYHWHHGLAALMGAVVIWLLPVVGAHSQIVRLESDLAEVTASRDFHRDLAAGLKTSLEMSQSFRETERLAALDAAAQDSLSCQARIETARKSARAIQTIITKEPTYDPSLCPARSLVDAELLRAAAGAD